MHDMMEVQSVTDLPETFVACTRCDIRVKRKDMKQIQGVDVCKGCFADAKRIFLRAIKVENFASRVQDLDIASQMEVADEITREFGGTRQFARDWVGQLRLTMAAEPGSKKALDGFAQMNKVLAAASEKKMAMTDVDHLSDADVDREIAKILNKVVDAAVS